MTLTFGALKIKEFEQAFRAQGPGAVRLKDNRTQDAFVVDDYRSQEMWPPQYIFVSGDKTRQYSARMDTSANELVIPELDLLA